MRGIERPTRDSLDQMNTRINDKMIIDIPNYNSTRWGRVLQSLDKTKWALEINNDSRNPDSALTIGDRQLIKQLDEKEYFPDGL